MTQYSPLPERPSLHQLKQQAYDIQRDAASKGETLALSDAYHQLALRYKFPSWPKLKQHVEFLNDQPLQVIIDAIHKGDPDELRRLLTAHPDRLHARRPDGYTLLHFAAGVRAEKNPRGIEILAILLDAGLPIDSPCGLDGIGATPLHFAAMCDAPDRVAYLLQRGADCTVESDRVPGATPLVHALFYAHRQNADILAKQAVTPLNLRVAAGLDRIELMESLLKPDGTLAPEAGQRRAWYRPHDGFPSWQTSDNPGEILGEALMYAAMNGRLQAVTWLLDHGVPIDARPYRNATALHWAAFRGQRQAIDLLLARGANIDIRDDEYNGFPWGWAGHTGHMDLERYLISKSKNLDIFQACNFAAKIDRLREMLDRDPQLVHARQPDPTSCGRHKHGTALHEAVDWYKRDFVLLLLERGADINARTAAGLTPLGIATQKGNQDAISLLQEKGGVV